jgi:hypothetical protein
VISFVVTTSLGFLIKFLIKLKREKVKKKTKNINTLRGGSLLDYCIEPKLHKVEIVDKNLRHSIKDFRKDSYIKELLKQTFGSKRPLVIIRFVMVLAVVNNSATGVSQVASVFGLVMFFNSFKSLYVKGYISSLGFTRVLLANVLFGEMMLRQLDCSPLMPELPQILVERTLSTSYKKKYFLDIPRNRVEEMIILKDFKYLEKSEIYFLKKVKEDICSAQIKKSGRISRDCENKKIYVRLNEMIITYKNVKRRDSSEIPPKITVAQENYEYRRNKSGNLRKTAESEA